MPDRLRFEAQAQRGFGKIHSEHSTAGGLQELNRDLPEQTQTDDGNGIA